jgi:hypothetical protein
MRLERYVQGIWAVIGTLVLVGMLLSVIVPVVVGTVWRRRGHGLRVTPDAAARAAAPAEQIVYGQPITSAHSDYVMIPVGLQSASNNALSLKSSSYAGSGSYTYKAFSIYHSLSWGRFYNLVFHHRKTGESHLLIKRKAAITAFYFPYEPDEEAKKHRVPKFLLFGIAEQDTDRNGLIDREDAVRGYLSDLAGTNLQPITPSGTQLVDWAFDFDDTFILLRVKSDSDRNGRFTDADAISVVRVDVNNPAPGADIVPQKLHVELDMILRGTP